MLKKLEQPLFIKISLFDTPHSPLSWKGYAVQTAGDDMYGKVILLENTYLDPRYKNIEEYGLLLYKEMEVCEWEWNGGYPVEGEELLHVKQLYEDYLKRNISQETVDIDLEENEENKER